MKNKPSLTLSHTNVNPAESIDIFDAIILYDTITAGKRGLSILGGMKRILSDNFVEMRPRPWRLDFLQDPSAAENAAEDLKSAQVLVISTSELRPLSKAFRRWFLTGAAQKRKDGQKMAVVALLGRDVATIQATSRDLEEIRNIALDADLDFFSPVSAQSTTFSFATEPKHLVAA